MKNPNGYGSVYRQKGNRRKPWIARKTNDWKVTEDKAIQKFIIIGYYETRAEAMQALALYNENPYNLKTSQLTFAEIFEKYKEVKFNKISQSNINGYNLAFKYTKTLHDKTFTEIKTVHLQKTIDSCKLSHGSKRKIKVLFNQLYKFAMQNDIIQKDYSKYIELRKTDSNSSRKPFTNDEIRRLFEVEKEIPFLDTILIMIYTGLRIGELLLIENSNIDLENRIMKGGIKTEAGKDRIIPLNKKIIPLIKKRLNANNTYLIVNNKGNKMKYDNYYRERFKPIMEQLGMSHKPHDCRHTFATLMSNSDANEVSIRKIIGHSSYEITEKIYTHKDIEELKKAIDLI